MNLFYSAFARFSYRSDFSEFVPKIQSHRGYCQPESGLRENTLASIQKAYELNYEMVEFDVRLTKDRHVVLFHDDRIENLVIANTNLIDLKSKIHVDTLSDIFAWFKYQINKSSQNIKFKLNIEIKSKVMNGHLEHQVFKLITSFELQKNVLISSFNPISLYHFYKFDPQIFRSLLLSNERYPGNILFVRSMVFNFMAKPNALHLRQIDWIPENFKKILNQKIPIVLWTCNDISKSRLYFKQGIAGVISDQILPDQIC